SFIFGHELARIKSSHLLYHQTAAVLPVIGTLLSNTTLGLGGLATSGMQIALLNWVMMAKFTADRAGLLACQEEEVALRTLIKLAGLPEKHINAGVIADFMAQAREFETQNFNSLDKVTRTLSYLDQLFAWAIMRASELLKWIDSGEYAALIQSPQPMSNDDASEGTKDWDFLGDW
ncbi:MAG: M48 family metallopeptidase, partial [Chloroflexaceae bacterium]|nr:M48 family metallopeptidase [Chloroflexaceae bacterium]